MHCFAVKVSALAYVAVCSLAPRSSPVLLLSTLRHAPHPPPSPTLRAQTAVRKITELMGAVLSHGVALGNPDFMSRMFGETAGTVRGLLTRREAVPTYLVSTMVGQLLEHVNAGLLDVKSDVGACFSSLQSTDYSLKF
jgi:hypothetical protein